MEFLTWPPENKPGPSDWVTVVGVVGDASQQPASESRLRGSIYYPLNQLRGRGFTSLEFSVRDEPAISAQQCARCAEVMHEVAPELPIEVLSPLSTLVGMERFQPCCSKRRLIAAFSLLAVVLAAVGTYSTLAYSVAQRRHELADQTGARCAAGHT